MWIARSLCVALLLITIVLTPRQTPAAQPGLSLQRLRPAALPPARRRPPRLLPAAPPSSAHTAAVTMTYYLPLLVFPPVWPITRVSVAADGAEGNAGSWHASISADGRMVAFQSSASNLIPGDTNGTDDVFVHDRQSGQTTRVSVAADGVEGNGTSWHSSISAEGHVVAFDSFASNLVPGDTNGTNDVFVHDRQTGQTTRVSVAADGAEGNADSWESRISADGRFVTFSSLASNLVPGDTNAVEDSFVHDRQTGQTTRVSVASDGSESNGWSVFPSILADGRFVAFASSANNLIPGDTNHNVDIFVHDRQTGQTTRVSVSSSGGEGNAFSFDPHISADGRFVAFDSFASTLVPGDTNAARDIFVHDRATGQTTRVSRATDGAEGNNNSYGSRISADGRMVTFESFASTLVPDDTNNYLDVFVHDQATGQTTRVSLAFDSAEANSFSWDPIISADGQVLAFASEANNLVLWPPFAPAPGDTNNATDVFVVTLPAAP